MTRVAIAALLCLSAAYARAEDWSKTFDVGASPHVRVTADDASVTVHGCDCHQVQAHVSYFGYRANRVSISPYQNGDEVSLSVRTHSGWTVGYVHRGIRVELTVPNDLALDVETGDGPIEARGLAGTFYLKTSDGNIEADLDGKVRARSGDGKVRLTGQFQQLDVNTGDGSVEVDAREGSKLASSWNINTGDGSIRLRVPQNLQATLQAHTGDGSIHSDLPITVSGNMKRDHELHGSLNGGGGSLYLHTGDGSIYLER
jgi:Putative adhesin